jgi:hypothetical protein
MPITLSPVTMETHQDDVGAGRHKARGSGGMWHRANALCGVLLLAALLVVVTHIGEERRCAALRTQAAPGWLLVAVVATLRLCPASRQE